MNFEESPVSVSVALCTFNSARFLQEELRSIERQTILPTEVVVCDDGSTDETLELLSVWKENVPFSVLIQKNKKNLGYTKNFEQAVSLCSGEIVLLADHDDVWLPTRVERVLEAFLRDSELGLISSDANIIDADGVDQKMRLSEFVERMRLREFWRFFFPQDMEMILWTGCTMAFRRRFLAQVLPIPAEMACHDVWFYLTFALISRVGFISEPLICYRLHGQNNSTAPTVAFLRKNPSRWRYFNSFTETLERQHPHLIESLEEFVNARLETGLSGRPEAETGLLGRWEAGVEMSSGIESGIESGMAQGMTAVRQKERLEKYLCSLKRHQRHFQSRRDSVRRPWLIFREILNLGYFRHPQPLASILYDLRECVKR